MEPLKLLSSFKDRRILVIGDVMLDEYFKGEITRISPEAPVPIVKVSEHSFSLGGAANVARNIVSLGGTAILLGIIGNDAAGEELKQLCKSEKIDVSGLAEDSRPTTMKSRILANNQQLLRYDQESNESISANLEEKILENVHSKAKEADALAISDYNKGVITPSLAKKLIGIANEAGIPVAIDSKNYLAYDMREATLLKPNLRELHKETGIDTSTPAGMEKAASEMMRKLQPKALLVTRGEHGMSLFEGAKSHEIPAIATSAVDVSGAGDTVLAAVSLGLASGNGLLESAILANYAASIAVRKVGTAAPTIRELRELVSESPGGHKK